MMTRARHSMNKWQQRRQQRVAHLDSSVAAGTPGVAALVLSAWGGLRSLAAAATVSALLSSAAVAADTQTVHGLSKYGDLKYPADFAHFEYANPDAIKGGSVVMSSLGSYDSLNPWILKGVKAAGIYGIYDTLMTSSADEAASYYGLIAESAELPDDRRWVIFNLRKEARWHDGVALTADDVVWTFETLTTLGHPFYKSYYADVAKVEKLGSHKVKFSFAEGNNPELAQIVGQLSILPKHYYETQDFSKTTLDAPLGSGPYRVGKIDAGRSITYERVEDYWGANLPVRVGSENFDSMRYDYYRDLTVALEALKAGDVDFRLEYISKNWKTAYDFPALNEGRVVKEALPDGNIQRTQAIVMNLRQPRFQDVRVRRAFDLLFDFEWLNKNLFYDAYKRNNSFFQNSDMQSSGLPEGLELEILNEYRDQLDDAIFTSAFEQPVNDGSGNIRSRYREAIGLLKDAGWVIKDQKLVNAESGEGFEVEFIIRQPSVEKIVLAYKKNLERVGIDLKVRVIDTAQYVKRLEEHDFDMTTQVIVQSLSPGNEQRDYWSTDAADEGGSRNLAGIKNPVVDALIERIVEARDRETMVAAARALDRVLLHGHYMILQYFGDTHRVAYWNRFSRPEIAPAHALGFGYWWVDPDKEAALKR